MQESLSKRRTTDFKSVTSKMAKTGSDFNDLTVKEKEMLEKGTKEQKEELSRYGWQSVRSLKSPDHKFTAS